MLRIIAIGTDKSVLDRDSDTRVRLRSYANSVDSYVVVVPNDDDVDQKEGNLRVIGIGGKNRISQLSKIYKKLKELAPAYDVITSQDIYYLGFIAYILSKKAKLGLELQVHGWEKFGGLRKKIANYILPRAGSVRTVSIRSEKKLVEQFNVKPENITNVPVSIDVPEFLPKRKKENDGVLDIVTVARLVPVKGIDKTFSALAQLKSEGIKFRYHLIGDGEERDNLKNLAVKLGIVEEVTFYGYLKLKDIYNIFASSDVFVLSSKSEGWGRVVLEAALMELPIIMTDVGLAGEVLVEGRSALIVKPGSSSEIVRSIKRLLTDPPLEEYLGKGAKDAVLSLPTREQSIDLYKHSWNRALEARQKGKKVEGLLVCTQKVDKNDDLLGFAHAWIEELSKNWPKVTVICLEKGEYSLPKNVEVLSLGKEKGSGKISRIVSLFKFVIQKRKSYSHVFVHMNSEYVVLCGKLWRLLLRKKVALWYTHPMVPWQLRVARIFVNRIFSTSPESCKLNTLKKKAFGHGIDTSKFKNITRHYSEKVMLLSLGRISKVKEVDVLVRAFAMLGPEFTLKIVGSAPKDEVDYEYEVHKLAEKLGVEDRIEWVKAVPNKKTPEIFAGADVFINMTKTGSFDKATLEASMAGCLPVVSNHAYKDMFTKEQAKALIFEQSSDKDLSQKLHNLLHNDHVVEWAEQISQKNIKNHGVETLISNISADMKSL